MLMTNRDFLLFLFPLHAVMPKPIFLFSQTKEHQKKQTFEFANTQKLLLGKNFPEEKKTELAVKNLAKENRNVNKLFATLNAAADGTSRMLFQMAVEGKLRAYDTIMHTASSLL